MKTRMLALIGIIVMAAAARLMPDPTNFAPITAMALFGGAHFADRRQAYLLPLAAMFLSDLVLGFHRLMPLTYLSFAVIVGMGIVLRSRFTVARLGSATVASSLFYFLVTNLGVWAFEGLYPHTAAGLATCFVAALPFLHNSLAGDLLFTGALFGGFALAERYVPALRAEAT